MNNYIYATGFLDTFLNNANENDIFDVKKIENANSVNSYYNFWNNALIERILKILTYKGIDEKGLYIPERNLSFYLWFDGFCLLVKSNDKNHKGEWIATRGCPYGITDYYTEFTDATYATPLTNGTGKIGKNVFMINANSFRTNVRSLLRKTALLLAHIDVSINNALITGRSVDLIVTHSKEESQAWDKFSNDRYLGVTSAHVNSKDMFNNIDIKPTSSKYSALELFDLRQKVIASFMESVGIKKSYEKKQRMIESEVTSDDQFRLLNLFDCVETQQHDFDIFNEVTGFNIKVERTMIDEEETTKEVEENGDNIDTTSGNA